MAGYKVITAGNCYGTTLTAGEAWETLAQMLRDYVERLADHDNLATHEAAWEMFTDDLMARSLTPWPTSGLLEGPDGELYGVQEA